MKNAMRSLYILHQTGLKKLATSPNAGEENGSLIKLSLGLQNGTAC